MKCQSNDQIYWEWGWIDIIERRKPIKNEKLLKFQYDNYITGETPQILFKNIDI
jgi:hypothetical protein